MDDRPELLRTVVGLPVPYTNAATAARIPAHEADRWVAETAELFREHRVPAIWWVGPLSEPKHLRAVLVRHGFVHDEEMPWLAADLEVEDLDAPGPRGLVVEAVDGPARQAAWLEVMTAGFGMNEAERESMTRLAAAVGYGPEARWRRFVGFLDGRPVGTSGVMLGGGVAGIYNVATIPGALRRGIGTAMTRVAMRAARDLGYRVAVLGSSQAGMSIYAALGFRDVCTLSLYRWPGPDGP